MAFTFNRNYRDLEQVAEWLPEFEAVLAELEAAGKYRYNDSFKGRIPGIEGECEDTAIYLLQGLERWRKQEVKVAELLDDGYEWLDELESTAKFARVILVPDKGQMQGPWEEFTDARVVPETDSYQGLATGKLRGVLPKGKRTHGQLINGRKVLVKT